MGSLTFKANQPTSDELYIWFSLEPSCRQCPSQNSSTVKGCLAKDILFHLSSDLYSTAYDKTPTLILQAVAIKPPLNRGRRLKTGPLDSR